jgi:hypothetical protein
MNYDDDHDEDDGEDDEGEDYEDEDEDIDDDESSHASDMDLSVALLSHPSFPHLVNAWIDAIRAGCSQEAKDLKALEVRVRP